MRFFYTLFLFFIFIVPTSFFVARIYDDTKITPEVLTKESKNRDLVLIPIVKENAIFPEVTAFSALAVDLDSDINFYGKNQDKPVLPASTTKIVTALVAIEQFPLNKVLKVGDVKIDGQRMHLVKDEEITVRDLIYGLLIFSANDAAEVLADNFDGGRDGFINEMNRKVQKLGLTSTFFNNPSGLDSNGHFTTAKDLMKISIVAMKNPFFREAVATKEMTVTSIDGKYRHRLVNINELLGKVDGVLGIKTGWTESAKENLVTYIERDGKRILIILLGSEDRFGETQKLIDWIFASYEWKYLSI